MMTEAALHATKISAGFRTRLKKTNQNGLETAGCTSGRFLGEINWETGSERARMGILELDCMDWAHVKLT